MLNTSNFNWKRNKLYLGEENTGFSVQQKFYASDTNFYWVRWPDGVLSEDFYNLTRAREHCISEATKSINNGVLVPSVLVH